MNHLSRRTFLLAVLMLPLLFSLTLTGCDLPKDPENTLERVRGGVVRVGVTENAPWVRTEGTDLAGVEVALLRQFAGELDAKVTFVQGSAPELLKALEHFELDVVVGGLTESSPGLDKVAQSIPYLTTRLAVGVVQGAPAFNDLSGREVAAPLGSETAALLKEQGAVPVLVRDLQGASPPIAAYDWQLAAWELMPTGLELAQEKHIMTAPPGENGWLVRLERFLDARRQRARQLLVEEARR